MTKRSLLDLRARWMSLTGARIGVIFDCPVCHRDPHEITVATADPIHWSPMPVFRSSGETLTALSLFPTIRGRTQQLGCHFAGWVKLGHVEWVDPNNKRVTVWEDV